MTKCFKYILAFFFIIDVRYAEAATLYINGPDNGLNTTRNDIIRIGNASGSFAGYSDPTAVVKTLNIAFAQSGTVPGGAITTYFTSTSFPSTLTDIWITGDATDFNILINGVARNALPTPPDNCTIHFLLSAVPADPVYWFQSTLGENCRVIVEPGSVDPHLGSALAGLAATNILVLGRNITTPASLTTVACKVQRHPSISAMGARDYARLTMSANTIFSVDVNGISIAGAFTSRFDGNSDIIDPASNVGAIGANGMGNALGTTLYIIAQAAALPDLDLQPISTGNVATTTKILTDTVARSLPILSPPLNTY